MKNNSKIKMFIIPIFIIIILLTIQALCDLELPNYTSNIINNGIQKNGISSSIPDALPDFLYDGIVRISGNNTIIKDSYELKTKDNVSKKEYETLKEKYPKFETENLYILKKLSKKDKEKLESDIIKPLIIATMFYSNHELVQNTINIGIQEKDNYLNWLMRQNDERFSNIITKAYDKFINIDDYLIKEFSIEAIKGIYEYLEINMNEYSINYVIVLGLQMLGIAGLGMLAAILAGYFISRLASTIAFNLRNKVVRKILALSTAEFKSFGGSSLITRATNDIEQIKIFFIMLLRIVIFAPLMGIGAFLKVYNNPLNWLIGLALIVIIIIIIFLFIFALPKFNIMQKLIDKINLISKEIITGMPVIRTFNNEEYEEKRFDKANQKLTKNNLFVNRTMGLMMPLMLLIMNVISVLIVWYGAKEIDFGNLEVGTLLAFITYTIQIIMSFLMISLISVILPRALVSLKRIREILTKEISIQEISEPVEFIPKEKGVIEFHNVTFKYPDADEAMLKNISFKSTPGTVTAFIGSTGSGKSTLVNLIPRLFDATSGEVLVHGINVKNASLKSLRSTIGYIPQKGFLFSGTICSNLSLGKDNLSEEFLKEIADVSKSSEFINSLDAKFASPIAESGSNVSGGQKQRLSIARALAINPDIYIFDDSFSALDFKTDAALRKSLKKYAKNATVLIVSGRINTIMNADKIIVLDEGEIVGIGTHKELLKTCEIYQEIAKSQLKEEEL